jgi:hypothetical protein
VFKETHHLLAVITKEKSMEYEMVMCHVQTHLLPVITKKKCEKVMYNVQTVISLTFCDYNTKSMEYEKVMQHVPTDIVLTCCDQSMKYESIIWYNKVKILHSVVVVQQSSIRHDPL